MKKYTVLVTVACTVDAKDEEHAEHLVACDVRFREAQLLWGVAKCTVLDLRLNDEGCG